ncbi:unnamed protein product [Schistosoma curassoni]|uniref:RSN1_7TM domain-containing protein n=1 Tax=Schistosoma curassoni TaxID=6186 RepID=A0A183KQA6_9TREM|nr:unnamed protein product [Schistosoma curassoni]
MIRQNINSRINHEEKYVLNRFSLNQFIIALLYILSPLAVCLLSGVLITLRLKYANSTNQLSDYYTKFYRLFFTSVPNNPDGVDTYHVQPLVWGFLSTFVHLTQSYNLWNGLYPTIGKLASGGRKMRHL